MNIISWFVDFVLHLDTHLGALIQTFGLWSYVILFLIIFCETGLVILPFLPGDSLLFAAGALAALGSFNILFLFIVIALAAVLGDTVNYSIGRYLGVKVLKSKSRFLKKEYLERTHKFFEKYGNKTIVIARFVPIIRTFAPFLAGVGEMSFWEFLSYNVVGGVAWVALFLFGGYFFGNIAFIKEHFSIVIICIIIISFIPVIVEVVRHKIHSSK